MGNLRNLRSDMPTSAPVSVIRNSTALLSATKQYPGLKQTSPTYDRDQWAYTKALHLRLHGSQIFRPRPFKYLDQGLTNI